MDITKIGLGVDTSKLQSGTRELDKFGSAADKAANKADNFTEKTSSLDKTAGLATKSLGVMAVGMAAIASINSLSRTIDEYTKLTAQLKLATRSRSEYNKAMDDVARIAKTSQSSLSSMATLYARLNNSLRDVGVSQDQVAKIAETVGLSLKVAGASAGESSSAMLQLSQAFGSGVLRGEEFNAMMESSPNLMRSLAESIGVPLGALRNLASEGKITGDILAKAFSDEKLLASLRQQSKEVETISGAWTNLSNRFVTVIGKINEATGASKLLIGALRGVEVLLSGFEGGEKGSIMRNFLDKGAKARQSTFDAMSTGQLREQAKFFGDAKIALAEREKIQQYMTLGGLNPSGNIAPNFNKTVEAQDINKIHKLQEEQASAFKDAQDKRDAIRKATNAEALKDIQDEVDFEEELKEAANEAEFKRIKEEQKAREDAYKEQLKQLDKLQDVANANYKNSQDVYIKAGQEKAREFEKTVDGIDQVFREGFANMVNGGKDTWKSFTKSLVTTFKTTVADAIYKMFAQPFIVKMVASLLGVGASGVASAAGLESNGGGIFSDISSKFDSIGSDLTSYVGKFGDWIGGLDDTGGFLNQLGTSISTNQLLISQGLAFSGAALQLLQGNIKGAATSAAGAGAGLLLSGGNPLGGAIGGAIGAALGSALGFGKKKTPRYDSAATGSYNSATGSFTAGQGATQYKALGANAQLNDLNKYFSQSLSSVMKSFGVIQNISTKSQLLQKRKNSYGVFEAQFGNSSLMTSATGSAKSPQATFNELVQKVMGETFVKAIGASKIPANIKKFFDGLINSQQISIVSNTLLKLKSSLLDLPKVFDAIRNTIETTSFKMKASKLNKLFNATGVFTSLFYSEAENLDTFTKQLTRQFQALNETLPTSRDEYRKLVDSIQVTDKASSKQFASLVSLAPAMDAYYKQLEAQKEATDAASESLKSLIDNLSSNGFKTLFDFNRYKKVAGNYGIDFANANPNTLPSYAVGSSYVPSDMTANIHRGERIIPAADNVALMARLTNPAENQAALIAEVKNLREELRRFAENNSAENQSTNLHLYSMKQDINKQVNDGIQISDTKLNGEPQVVAVRVVV